MANEAVCIELPRVIKRIYVSDLVAIPLGTILKLSGDNTGIASSGADVFCGITIEEKTASDTLTNIGVALDGVWDIVCNSNAGITLGGMVVLSGTNVIRQSVEADFPLGAVFGKAMEAAGAAERISVRLGLN